MIRKQLTMQYQLLVLVLLIFGSWLVSLQLSEYLIELVYEDQLSDAFNALLSNKQTNSLQYYVDRARGPLSAFHSILAIIGFIYITRVLRRPLLVLGLLLAGDIVLLFFSAHHSIWLLNVRVDWSIPEIYQYLKEILSTVLLVFVFRHTSERLYLVFAALAAFMFIDDALKYHEHIGHFLSPVLAKTSLPDILQTAPNYIGEVLSLVPLVLVAPIAIVLFFKANREAKIFAIILTTLLGFLFVFGVIFDFFVHSGLTASRDLVVFMSLLEDSGEMVVMSFITAFVVAHAWRNEAKSDR